MALRQTVRCRDGRLILYVRGRAVACSHPHKGKLVNQERVPERSLTALRSEEDKLMLGRVMSFFGYRGRIGRWRFRTNTVWVSEERLTELISPLALCQ